MYDTFIDTSASTTQANNRLRQEYIRLYLIFLPGSNNKKNSQSTDQVVLLIPRDVSIKWWLVSKLNIHFLIIKGEDRERIILKIHKWFDNIY